MSTTPRRDTEEVREELRAIYTDKDGVMPDFTRLERRPGSALTRGLILVVVVLGILAAASWSGFFIWSRGWFARETPLVVTLDGAETVKAGQLAFFTVQYENRGKVPLASLDLNLHLPPGFSVVQTDPAPTENFHWQLGNLSPGSDGSIVVSGIFRSEVPSEETLQAFFTYRPGNYTTDFESIATEHVTIQESVLRTSVTGPEKALSGDDVQYVINVQNTGTRAVEGVGILAELPTGFTIQSSEPAVSRPDVAEWVLGTIEPGALAAVTLTGRYTSDASGDQRFGVRTILFSTDEVLLTQGSTETHTDVLGGNLAFHVVVNGSTSEVAVNPGETLRLSTDYTNSGSEALGNVVLTLMLDGAGKPLPIDWEKAELGGATRSGTTLRWDSSAIPSFLSLPPGESGVLDVTLPLLKTVHTGLSDRFLTTLNATLDKVGSVEAPRSVATSPVTIKLNSDFKATAEARYYTAEAEPLGTGPLPPKVGETTTYRVFWKVTNGLHPLSGTILTTNLPPDVAWTDNTKVDRGTITFDQTTRLVTWNIGSLPTTITTATATFDVAITPDASDVGAFFKLTNATSADATDDISAARLSRAIDILTTELTTDETANGKGVVVD